MTQEMAAWRRLPDGAKLASIQRDYSPDDWDHGFGLTDDQMSWLMEQVEQLKQWGWWS